MKLNTLAKYRWTADLRLPVQRQDGQFTYEFQREVRFELTSGMAQTYAYSKEALDWAAELVNITNHLGQKPYIVQDREVLMYVTSSSPVFDIYGKVEGYQHVLLRTKPNRWEDAQVESTEGN